MSQAEVIDRTTSPKAAVVDAAVTGLDGYVRSLLADDTAVVTSWRADTVDYAIDTPTTGSLLRLHGAAATRSGRQAWSLFVKEVHSLRRWPRYDDVVDHLPGDLLTEGVWRHEVDAYREGRIAAVLPDGLRMARCFDAVDIDDESVALVLEDVDAVGGPWDRARYRRAAFLLGRLNAVLSRDGVVPGSANLSPNQRARATYASRLRPMALPALAADEVWSHPAVRRHADARLRRDLTALAERLPAMVAALGDVPQVMGHGDACPDNLLVARREPATFVVIDWAMAGWSAVGDDLGQLLVGGAHSGHLPADALALRRAEVLEAYVAGLVTEGCAVDADHVRFGLDVGLVVRSAFTALPLERLNVPLDDDLDELFRQRLALTRVLVDVGLALG